ncbi:MAG TPA: GvpL/GvpF family gas vesicle protein [Blastocatellia bacterium]|nr:GvpL/GvpF family gas vesicle protein [Blastocatellia bacterium]
MSSRRPKKQRGVSDGPENKRALYVYCIGERAALEPLLGDKPPGAIETDAPLELVTSGGLAAVVSAVPLSDYGEQPLQARLADPAWTALRAMRHEKVNEYFAARASVIPLRFGTIYLRRERVENLLSEKGNELHAIIERLRGREEWGVNIYRDQAALMRAIGSLSPRLRELSERAAAAAPGQAYLLRKQIDALSADEARAETKRVIAEVQRGLAEVSAGTASLRLSSREVSEQGEVVAKLAFLVARARFDEFRAAAEELARTHAGAGFRLELTGPWPAYNFSTVTE